MTATATRTELTVEQAEARILADNARPLALNDYGDFVELRCAVERLEDAIQRVAEEHGVADPGAATPTALLLEMRHAVDAFAAVEYANGEPVSA
jgi:hypothetical protein